MKRGKLLVQLAKSFKRDETREVIRKSLLPPPAAAPPIIPIDNQEFIQERTVNGTVTNDNMQVIEELLPPMVPPTLPTKVNDVYVQEDREIAELLEPEDERENVPPHYNLQNMDFSETHYTAGEQINSPTGDFSASDTDDDYQPSPAQVESSTDSDVSTSVRPQNSIPDDNNDERRSRKRLRNEHNWAKNKKKLLVNSGQAYVTASGREKRAKKMGISCGQKCKLKCSENFTEEERQMIFNNFYKMSDRTRQRDFISKCMVMTTPRKYRREEATRKLNYAYFFYLGNLKKRVCKTFFKNTLDITNSAITTVQNMTNTEGFTENECRGFEDTHVMIFIGFGFLMTFLKRYSYSALGFNFFLAALVTQWALLCQNFFNMKNSTILLNKETLFEADTMAATILITFGALLGRASGYQLMFIAIVETVVASANMFVLNKQLMISDAGGSLGVHTFGAYFGLGASFVMCPKEKRGNTAEDPQQTTSDTHPLEAASYQSDVTAMIGTLFLFVYWPSFNAYLTHELAEYQRAVINTYLSLASCAMTTFILSSLVDHSRGNKFDMVHIQNSTLAGGVAAGAICNMFLSPGGAVAVGMAAAFISVFGYKWLTPKLTKCGLRDTCGVHNLHGMPGVFSGILAALLAFIATKDEYGKELDSVFGAMKGDKRSAALQAAFQLGAVPITVFVAFIFGTVTGLIANFIGKLKEDEKYNDEPVWEMPE